MATHSSILAWRIPWIKEPGGLQSMGSQKVGHDLSDLEHTHTQPTAHDLVMLATREVGKYFLYVALSPISHQR